MRGFLTFFFLFKFVEKRFNTFFVLKSMRLDTNVFLYFLAPKKAAASNVLFLAHYFIVSTLDLLEGTLEKDILLQEVVFSMFYIFIADCLFSRRSCT